MAGVLTSPSLPLPSRRPQTLVSFDPFRPRIGDQGWTVQEEGSEVRHPTGSQRKVPVKSVSKSPLSGRSPWTSTPSGSLPDSVDGVGTSMTGLQGSTGPPQGVGVSETG